METLGKVLGYFITVLGYLLGGVLMVLVLIAFMVLLAWADGKAIRDYRNSYAPSIKGTITQETYVSFHCWNIYWQNGEGKYFLTILELLPNKSAITMPVEYQSTSGDRYSLVIK